MLESGDDAIARIATRVGYETTTAFSKAFKQHYSFSPGRYRAGNSKGYSAHCICMFLLRPESEYSGGLNSSLVGEPITFNPVGGLIAMFAGAWISDRSAAK